MASNRITEKEIVSVLKDDAYVLITQPELVGGVQTEALRRARMDHFANAVMEVMNLTMVNGKLCVRVERRQANG